MKDLRGKVIVVTGAGSGIGRASAEAFTRGGGVVHLVDANAERLEEVRASLDRCGAPGAESHCLDCTDPAAMEALAARVLEAEGRVDILQLGVGIIVAGAFEETSLEQWRRVIDTNLWSTVHGLRAFLPAMLDPGGRGEGRGGRGGGSHVVIVASLSGLVGFPYTSAYTATKFALVGLAEALSLEFAGRGVGVTAVCPGAVNTNLFRDGQMRLPGGSETAISGAVERFAAKPERVAREIVQAVRFNRPLILPSSEALPLWLLKRASQRLFSRAGQLATSQLRRLASR